MAYLPKIRRGEDNNTTKLTEVEVKAIRRRAANGESRKALAEEYGVNVCTINCIIRRQTWKHI